MVRRNGGKKNLIKVAAKSTKVKKKCEGTGCSNELVSSRAKLCFACFRIRAADTGKKLIKRWKNDDKVCSTVPKNDDGRKGGKSCRS